MEVGRSSPGAQRAQESYRAAREELARVTRERVRRSREVVGRTRPERADRLDISNASREVLARIAASQREVEGSAREKIKRLQQALSDGSLATPERVRKTAARILAGENPANA